MTFHFGNNLPRIVMKNQSEQLAQRCTVRSVSAQHRSRMLTP